MQTSRGGLANRTESISMTAISNSDLEAQMTQSEDDRASEHSQRASRSPSRSQNLRNARDDALSGNLCQQSFDGSSNSARQEACEEKGLYLFAEALRNEKSPPEPWFMEMTRLRRLHFLYLNKQLAACKRKILESERATDEDMKDLATVLHEQAEAIRDLQSIRALDFLPAEEYEKRHQQSMEYFPQTGRSHYDDVLPFQTENYRCLPPLKNEESSDGVREFLRSYMPVQWSWSTDDKEAKPDLYHAKYKPRTLSRFADRFARFIVAITGALFILVPMYIMAINQSSTKNLVTTTVAVVLFATLSSVTLRTSNDQTLGATAGYAAVLMVFVGLTS